MIEFPEFRPRPPWLGADLQTLRNLFRGPVTKGVAGEGERLLLAMRDGSGDQLAARLHSGANGADPLVVLIHGLSGSEDSDYLLASAAHLNRAGYPVLRLSLRGAGPSRPTCRLQYHAGRTADLHDVLAALTQEHGVASLFLVGYSLGGNMLLKFLAEYGAAFPIAGAASVSAPIELEAASRRILERRNRPYHSYLLGRMRAEALGEGARLDSGERRAIEAARTILDFDNEFVAPRNGYAGARAYYEENSALRFLDRIAVPTLVVHALDDPWIPGRSYESYDWTANPRLTPLLPRGGGHVGFHGAGSRVPWHDRCIERFLDAVSGRGASSSASAAPSGRSHESR